jgi:hypothetical protein
METWATSLFPEEGGPYSAVANDPLWKMRQNSLDFTSLDPLHTKRHVIPASLVELGRHSRGDARAPYRYLSILLLVGLAADSMKQLETSSHTGLLYQEA